MKVSFCAVLFLRDVLDEILNLIESVLRVFLPTLEIGRNTIKTTHKAKQEAQQMVERLSKIK